MSATVILNIGLKSKTLGDVPRLLVEQILASEDILIADGTIVDSDTEPTFAARVTYLHDGQSFMSALHRVARDLGQDAIAVWSPYRQRGALFGPNAKAWGPFDATRFLLLDGSRLSTHLRATA